MKPRDLDARKLDLLHTVADRWVAQAPRIAETAARLRTGGTQAAATPERVEMFRARESIKFAARVDVGLERIIGGSDDIDDVPSDDRARRAGRPVARIVELLSSTRVGDGFATGFLVRPGGPLLTNWHVFADADEARGCGAQFGFERDASGLLSNGSIFELDPDRLFLSDKRLDIALIGVRPAPTMGTGTIREYGSVRLIPSLGKILVGQPLSIIQHPAGRHKHWAERQNKLLLDPTDADLFLTYSTDTLQGSSGSPAFNYDWELIAVHRCGVPRKVNGQIVTRTGQPWRKGMPEEEVDWVANEGTRISRVYEFLKAARCTDASQQAMIAALVSGAVDPVLSEAARELQGRPTSVAAAAAAGNISMVEQSHAAALEHGGGRMNISISGTANFYVTLSDHSAFAARGLAVEPGAGVANAPAHGLEKKLRFDSDYDSRPGYQSDFLEGFDVPAPKAPADEALKEGGEAMVLRYHHYSLVMHEKRRLLIWAAANVDYDPNKRWRSRKEFGTDTWKPDPRVLIGAQIEDVEFYDPATKFDRGHIVRREDVAWGEDKREEEFGNSDSFHWTNCTPQHERFNRDMFEYNGLWGQLENHISKQAGFVQNRLTLMSGPILDVNDPRRDFGSGIKVQVPMAFWKVVVVVETTHPHPTLRAYGFILDQTEAIREYGWESRFRIGKFKEHQVRLAEITQRSRVEFDESLHAADPLAGDPNESGGRSLRTFGDLKLR